MVTSNLWLIILHMTGVTSTITPKNWPDNFFDTKPGDLCRDGVNKLAERWEEVVKSNGECIID